MTKSDQPQLGKPSASRESPLEPFSRPGVAAALSGLTVLLLILFNQFPQVDIATAEYFFTPRECEGETVGPEVCGSFAASQNDVANVIRDTLHVLPVTVAVLLLIAAGFAARRKQAGARRFARSAVLAITSLVLCSLLLVNVVLKTYSGRPRPYQTDFFGGDLPFVPAGIFTDYCGGNCSFVSGEASAAFWLVCLAGLVGARHRTAAFLVLFAVAASASMLRVAFGGHYLSDVVVAAVMSLAVFACLASVAKGLGILDPKGIATRPSHDGKA